MFKSIKSTIKVKFDQIMLRMVLSRMLESGLLSNEKICSILASELGQTDSASSSVTVKVTDQAALVDAAIECIDAAVRVKSMLADLQASHGGLREKVRRAADSVSVELSTEVETLDGKSKSETKTASIGEIFRRAAR